MKKILTILLLLMLSLCFTFSVSACNNTGDDGEEHQEVFKVGIICSGSEDDFYDFEFIDAFKKVCQQQNVEYVVKTNISETRYSYVVASDLVNAGCDLIFANSPRFEDYMWELAGEKKEVQFCQASGIKDYANLYTGGKRYNFHNVYLSVYQTKYLAGYASGLKLNEMKDKAVDNQFLVGYVAPFTNSEYISSYTAWFLGLKSALDKDYTAKMQVYFTGDLHNEYYEETAVETLLENKCVLIGSDTQSFTVSNLCEENGIPHTGVNGDAMADCPNTLILATKTDWKPYFEYIITKTKNSLDFASDWFGEVGESIYEGTSFVTEIGDCAVQGTEEKLNTVFQELVSGTRKVFPITAFTEDGKQIEEELKLDLNDDYDPDTIVVMQDYGSGEYYFAECEHRSYPYFAIEINDIELINRIA